MLFLWFLHLLGILLFNLVKISFFKEAALIMEQPLFKSCRMIATRLIYNDCRVYLYSYSIFYITSRAFL